MTVEAIAPQSGGDERLRNRALDTLRTQALEAVLASNEPLRTVDVARTVAERLGITLTEEEMGGLASVVRMVMDNDPLFSQSNRQWDLALRMGRAEGDRRKPVERAVEDFVDLLGSPSTSHPVAVLVASVYGRPVEYYERMIERVVPVREEFFPIPPQKIGIRRWLIELSSDDPADVEEDNFEDARVLNEVRSLAADVAVGDSAIEYATAIVKAAGKPVDNRSLIFLVWSRFPEVEPSKLFIQLLRRPDVVLERGPAWVTPAGREEVLGEVRQLLSSPEEAADLVAAALPVEEEEVTPGAAPVVTTSASIGILAPTTIRVSDEDLNQVYEFMLQASDRSYRVPELCQQVLEAFPGSRTYSGVHDSLLNRMREDARFQWVGSERYRIAGNVPPEVDALPEDLAFDDGEYEPGEGIEPDRVVDPREWKHGLEEQVLHYLVQDVGDDSTTAPARPPANLVSSPPLHHYVAGTRYLRNADRGFFPREPELVQVSLTPNEGERFDVWINHRLGLIFGLKEWYDANLPWVGGHFVIEPTDQPDEFRLIYNGEVDPEMNIQAERLPQLLALRSEAATQALPLHLIVQRLLKDHPDGVSFLTLFTELNVVRRSRRAQLASALSAQKYFVPVNAESPLWMYDEKRAQKTKGKKKGGPRRPAREMYNEDDDDTEFEYE